MGVFIPTNNLSTSDPDPDQHSQQVQVLPPDFWAPPELRFGSFSQNCSNITGGFTSNAPKSEI